MDNLTHNTLVLCDYHDQLIIGIYEKFEGITCTDICLVRVGPTNKFLMNRESIIENLELKIQGNIKEIEKLSFLSEYQKNFIINHLRSKYPCESPENIIPHSNEDQISVYHSSIKIRRKLSLDNYINYASISFMQFKFKKMCAAKLHSVQNYVCSMFR